MSVVGEVWEKRLERAPGTAWRREAEVALDGSLADTVGVRAARVVRVDEDDDGVTVVTELVEKVDTTGPHLARALGVFAGNDLAPQPWWETDLLGDRLRRVADRGGWPTLARTTLADVSDVLWSRRTATRRPRTSPAETATL